MALITSDSCRTIKGCVDMLHNSNEGNSSAQSYPPPVSFINPILTQRVVPQGDRNLLAVMRNSAASTFTQTPFSETHNLAIWRPSIRQTTRADSTASDKDAIEIQQGRLPKSTPETHQYSLTSYDSISMRRRPSTAECKDVRNLAMEHFESFNQIFDGQILPDKASGDRVACGRDRKAIRRPLIHGNADYCQHPAAMSVDQIIEANQAQSLLVVDDHATCERLDFDAVLVRARHDRHSLYIARVRPDGSQSFNKVLYMEETQPETGRPPTHSTAARRSVVLQDIEDLVNVQDSDGAGKDGKEETSFEFKARLTQVLKQMMFVSGEQAEPSTETTWMIEEIVREQVVEMLKEATMLANRRGSKSISIVDLIFQIRHNPAKVSRLKTFLSWKDVRKNVKDSDDKAGGADADALDLEDGALPGANPAAPQKSSSNRKAKLVLPWEVQSFYNETVPEREDEEDEEEEEQNEATLARLASADERTRNMTREEYVYWSDCRQASFTFRKGKRFREWAGFGTIIDSKPNDDVVDILGFLTFEIVQTLTEEALRVKNAEDVANKKANGPRGDSENSKKRKREGCTLFEMVEEDKTPVEPKHVREAFRRLQLVPKKYTFMRQGYAGVRTPLRMI